MTELDYKESWVRKNWCFWTVVLEKTLESPLDCKEIQPVHLKGDRSVLGIHWRYWCWSWNSNTLATSCGELTHLKRPWCWERLKAGEGDERRRGRERIRCLDGITDSMEMSLSRLQELVWTGKPGMLRFMGSQRVGYDWTTELNWKENCSNIIYIVIW